MDGSGSRWLRIHRARSRCQPNLSAARSTLRSTSSPSTSRAFWRDELSATESGHETGRPGMNGSKPDASFCSIPEAIEDFRTGKMVLIVDDEDRENEGDIAIAS